MPALCRHVFFKRLLPDGYKTVELFALGSLRPSRVVEATRIVALERQEAWR